MGAGSKAHLELNSSLKVRLLASSAQHCFSARDAAQVSKASLSIRSPANHEAHHDRLPAIRRLNAADADFARHLTIC